VRVLRQMTAAKHFGFVFVVRTARSLARLPSSHWVCLEFAQLGAIHPTGSTWRATGHATLNTHLHWFEGVLVLLGRRMSLGYSTESLGAPAPGCCSAFTSHHQVVNLAGVLHTRDVT
jgi:hypothetical protein